MDKQTYLKSIENILEKNHVNRNDIAGVMADYSDLFDEGLEKGLTNEEIIEKLGSPQQVYLSVKYEITYHKPFKDKITPLMVFIAVIAFFLVGYFASAWQYSWMFFLLIPLSAFICDDDGIIHNMPGITLFVSLILFLTFGQLTGLWHPLWLLFLLVPLSALIFTSDVLKNLAGIAFFTSIIVYFAVAHFEPSFYSYGWVVFLLTPLLATLKGQRSLGKLIGALLLIISVITYLVLGFTTGEWTLSLLVFLVVCIYAMLTGSVSVKVGFESDPFLVGGNIAIIAAYFIVSLVTGGWGWTWMILLLVPIYSIFKTKPNSPLVSYTPFIAVILFYSIGYFVEGGFSYSWLAFLLIPMFGIVSRGQISRYRSRDEMVSNEILMEDHDSSPEEPQD